MTTWILYQLERGNMERVRWLLLQQSSKFRNWTWVESSEQWILEVHIIALPDGTWKCGESMMAVTATDFKIGPIELGLRVASYEIQSFTLWRVPAKFNCFGFIRNRCRLLGDVENGPEQYNQSLNVFFDENYMSRLKCDRYFWAAKGVRRDKNGGKISFWTMKIPMNSIKLYFL